MRRIAAAHGTAWVVLRSILPVVTLLTSTASATELRLSASVRADVSGGREALADYLVIAGSDEIALGIADALRPHVSNLNYQYGRVLTLSSSSSKIAEVLKNIPAVDGVVNVDRKIVLRPGPTIRTSTVPFSKNAQLAHNVPGLVETYKVTGKGVGVAIWDEGPVLASHLEFDGRVELRDTGEEPNDHATQVAGNIAARGDKSKGDDPDAQGIAPESRILSFSWKDDLQKLRRFAETDVAVHITNHSYSVNCGWQYVKSEGLFAWYGDPRISPAEDYRFGKYDARSAEIDAIVADYPRLSIFIAAGNNRDPKADPKKRDPDFDGLHLLPVLQAKVDGPMRPEDRQHDGGYDTLEDFGVAKNVITVGAMEDIAKGKKLDPANVKVTEFSNWGPTDDGRIKPDVLANGSDLRTPIVVKMGGQYDKRATGNKNGTSMASPTAAGVAALLIELGIARRGKPLRGDEMKAVLIATAVSPQPGPSYRTGWGAIDALGAGAMVAGDSGALITRTATVEPIQIKLARTSGPMRLTMTWIDPPAGANEGGLNDRSSALTFDFDLELIDPTGKPHFPWSLDPERPAAEATASGPNRRDNVERIDVDREIDGTGGWLAKITAPAKAAGHQIAIAIQGFRPLK